MWQAAIQGDVLDASGNRARSLSDTPTDDLDWLAFGIATVMAATARVRTAIDLSLLLLLVFTLAEPYGGGPATLDELHDLWWNQDEYRDDPDLSPTYRDYVTGQVDALLALLGDCGLGTQRGHRASLTPFGWDFSLALVHLLDNTDLDDLFALPD